MNPNSLTLQPIRWEIGEDKAVNTKAVGPIRVMRVIARMNIGGPAVQVSGLMQNINSTEFQQRLYTGFCGPDEADYINTIAKDIEATRVTGFGRRINIVGDLRALLSLITEIRKFKPHVIHTHTAKAGFLGRLASILALHSSIRVHTFHGHLLDGYFGSVQKTLVVMAERFLAKFTHQLLAVGDKVRQDLLDAGIGKIEKFSLMHPGLQIQKLPNKIETRASFGLSLESLQCAFIGRVTKIKRPDRFLDVVTEIKKRGLDIEFIIAGDGELLQSCRSRIINENLPVKVLGWEREIEKVLSAADLVILTSDNEGTPLCLIQAGMAGLPVVATNVGSVAEIVINEVTGLVTNLEVQGLSDALERMFKNNALRVRMGKSAQDFTLSNFGVDRLVYDHEQLYKQLVSNRAKS